MYIDMEFNKLKFDIQKQNGRVVNLDEAIGGPSLGMIVENDNAERIEGTAFRMLYGIREPTEIDCTFFSDANIDVIQNRLRYEVFKANNAFVIDKQPKSALLVIMRGIVLQHGRNLNTVSVKDQVSELNQLVLNYSVPNVVSQVEQFLNYKKDVEGMRVPIELPKNVSNAGTRLLKSVMETF